jgi:hypothetical protein
MMNRENEDTLEKEWKKEDGKNIHEMEENRERINKKKRRGRKRT